MIDFGYNAAAVGSARWVLERSPDLNNWTPVFNNTNPGAPVTITDPNGGVRFFYRFTAELIP